MSRWCLHPWKPGQMRDYPPPASWTFLWHPCCPPCSRIHENGTSRPFKLPTLLRGWTSSPMHAEDIIPPRLPGQAASGRRYTPPTGATNGMVHRHLSLRLGFTSCLQSKESCPRLHSHPPLLSNPVRVQPPSAAQRLTLLSLLQP